MHHVKVATKTFKNYGPIGALYNPDKSRQRVEIHSSGRLRSRRVVAHASFLRTSFDVLPQEFQRKHGQNGTKPMGQMAWRRSLRCRKATESLQKRSQGGVGRRFSQVPKSWREHPWHQMEPTNNPLKHLPETNLFSIEWTVLKILAGWD